MTQMPDDSGAGGTIHVGAVRGPLRVQPALGNTMVASGREDAACANVGVLDVGVSRWILPPHERARGFRL
jgi:hypothetical protein